MRYCLFATQSFWDFISVICPRTADTTAIKSCKVLAHKALTLGTVSGKDEKLLLKEARRVEYEYIIHERINVLS